MGPMLVLLGVLLVVAGFAVGLNPLLVVLASALATGLAAGLSPMEVLAAFGKAFNENRYVSAAWLILPVIGVLERSGLQEAARGLIARLRSVTFARLMLAYLLFRQVTAALGLISIAGQTQTIRPIIAPMAEAARASETGVEALDSSEAQKVRAFAAGTDNIGLFFGEDIFLAIGSILLMVGFLEQNGITVEPLHLSVWAIPTAIAAFLVHGCRILLFGRRRPRP
jgi:uncharacterized membrane protein